VTVAYRFPPGVDEAYRVNESRVGCTLARKFARRWYAAANCRGLAPGASCRVRGAACRAISGGLFDPRAQARCVPTGRPRAWAEITALHGCPRPPTTSGADVYAWAINVDCSVATGFPIDQAFDSLFSCHLGLGPCAPVDGFACTVANVGELDSDAFRATCSTMADAFRAVELVVVLPF
jgi:hypothetical protein